MDKWDEPPEWYSPFTYCIKNPQTLLHSSVLTPNYIETFTCSWIPYFATSWHQRTLVATAICQAWGETPDGWANAPVCTSALIWPLKAVQASEEFDRIMFFSPWGKMWRATCELRDGKKRWEREVADLEWQGSVWVFLLAYAGERGSHRRRCSFLGTKKAKNQRKDFCLSLVNSLYCFSSSSTLTPPVFNS